MKETRESETVSMNLNELLKYQSGAVVSKVLLKKSSGNITLFAFDKGEGLSEHTAPFDAFVQITDGRNNNFRQEVFAGRRKGYRNAGG